MRGGFSLYLHYPFCRRICPYCSFVVKTANADRRTQYLRALRREIVSWHGKAPFAGTEPGTVYFGGGTPSMMSVADVALLMDAIDGTWGLSSAEEITLELEPKTKTVHELQAMRSLGINRLSIGFQSLHPDELEMLGRAHKGRDALRAVDVAREAGFENVSMDLMYGIPGQTLRRWRHTLHAVLALRPDHISTYGLTLERGTTYHQWRHKGWLTLLPDALVSRMYRYAVLLLEKAGFVQYELSNFARHGAQSIHNQNYWNGAQYLGLGVSAASFADNRRWRNVRAVSIYQHAMEQNGDVREEEETLSREQRFLEALMLGLRTGGVNLKELAAYADRPYEDLRRKAMDLTARNLLTGSGDHYALTLRGKCVADAVIADF